MKIFYKGFKRYGTTALAAGMILTAATGVPAMAMETADDTVIDSTYESLSGIEESSESVSVPETDKDGNIIEVASGVLDQTGGSAVSVAEAEVNGIEEAEAESSLLLARRLQRMAENSQYDIAICKAEAGVSVYDQNTEAGNVVGRIGNNAVATVIGSVYAEGGTWYQIQSGDITGYVKADSFLDGAEAQEAYAGAMQSWAVVKVESLRLREQADENCDTLTLLSNQERYQILEQNEEYTKIKFSDTIAGYVPNCYIDVDQAYLTAVSAEAYDQQSQASAQIIDEQIALDQQRDAQAKAESEAAARAEAAAKAEAAARAEAAAKAEAAARAEAAAKAEAEAAARAEAAAKAEAEAAAETTKAPETTAAAETTKAPETTTAAETTKAPAASYSELRDAVVAKACSYVGKLDYVYGGTSLTTGVDCSGFIQSIFAIYGIDLPRTGNAQAKCGTRVSSLSAARPGDFIQYNGHVALYIGNGKIVHASQSGTKIKISNVGIMSIVSIRNFFGD